MASGSVLIPVLAAACLLSAGCGYVGEVLPPALNIPSKITNLTAVQRGNKIVVTFTVPQLTTENLVITKIGEPQIQIGGKTISVKREAPGSVTEEIPVADWIGQQPAIKARVQSTKGRFSDWSNEVVVSVIEPLSSPSDVKAEAAPKGVRLSWGVLSPRTGETYRVTRSDKKDAAIVDKTEFLDTDTQYGKEYQYRVQAVLEKAESEPSAIASVTPKDIFPPDTPSGVNAIAGINTVELNWDPSTADDLKGYRIYRSVDNGPFQVAAEMLETPAFSDKQVQSGKTYRYAVTAIDQTGNESGRSTPAEIKVQ